MINKLKNHTNDEFKDLFIKGYDYDDWVDIQDDEKLHDETVKNDEKKFVDTPSMSLLEEDEEVVRERKRTKFLTPSRLLTIPPVLLTQIKAGKNAN